MSDEPQDVQDITAICGGLNINIGTLNVRTIEGMLAAGHKANELNHMVLLDPVGAGASSLRTNTAVNLMQEIKFDVIRGNISEIKTLAAGSGTTKGVDADVADAVTEENLDEAVAFAKAFSEKSGSIVAITGAIDLVSDGRKCYVIRNGRAEMGRITGTGCQLSGLRQHILLQILSRSLRRQQRQFVRWDLPVRLDGATCRKVTVILPTETELLMPFIT